MEEKHCRLVSSISSSPLIDTHVHLGGCITPKFIWNVIQSNGLKYLAENYEDVLQQMTFRDGENHTFHRFLDKFKILDEINWSEELIDLSIKDVCQFLDYHNIAYAWMDFSINKYMSLNWHKIEAVKFIYDSFNRYRPNQVGLVLSLKYESPRPSQKQYAKLIEHEDSLKYLIGLDLVGDEAYFDSDFYEPLFKDWNNAGMMTRAHVGESSHQENIRLAITKLNVTNIAHGIKIECYEDIDLALSKSISFDLAITSNFVTGVCLHNHPVKRMVEKGLRITIGSDDPVQCATNLSKEYETIEQLGLSLADCETIQNNAIDNTIALLKKQSKIVHKSLLINN